MSRREAMLKRIGQDFWTIREGAGISQSEIASDFGWGRDAMSKLERGLLNIGLADYLLLMDSLRPFTPDHPAHALLEHLNMVRIPHRKAPRKVSPN